MSPRHSVLLVDDDDDLRSLLTVAFLVTGNWEVTSAGTAEEAADYRERTLPLSNARR